MLWSIRDREQAKEEGFEEGCYAPLGARMSYQVTLFRTRVQYTTTTILDKVWFTIAVKELEAILLLRNRTAAASASLMITKSLWRL